MKNAIYPSLEDARKISKSKEVRKIPISLTMLADNYTPIRVLRSLKAVSDHCFLLESAEHDHRQGRYSILGYDPKAEITLENRRLKISQGEKIETIRTEHPEIEISNLLKEYKSISLDSMPPFTGGLVGFFSYDFIRYTESVLYKESPEGDFPDLDLMLFDKAIVFDHYTSKLYLIANIDNSDIDKEYRNGEAKLLEMKKLLESGVKAYFKPLSLKEELTPAYSKERYVSMVDKARKYIYEGDIFQVVLSNPQRAKATGSLFDTYRLLRSENPSPYMFYFTSSSTEVAGASPETLVKKEGRTIHTYPLAGTRPRGKSEKEDEEIEKDLLSDEKELAEHNMLVDLGRNDIGRVSAIGSVKVEKYMQIERFSHVMHIGSEVTGELRDDLSALDAISSILPAGTLSGAPKIRACEIIEELEGDKRGLYGGAIGYLDFKGDMDTAIAIRLAYMKNGYLTVQSGAGIVADSIPENEWNECTNKAKAVAKAIKEAEGGIE